MTAKVVSEERAGDAADARVDPEPDVALAPNLAGAIAESLAAVEWPGARRAALRDRVVAAASAPHAAGVAPQPVRDPHAAVAMRVQRTDEGRWYTLLPRIALKPLRIDRDARTQTALWKLEPGARIPAHEHGGEEECLVLSGAVEYEGARYGAGDYLLALPGYRHEEIASRDGATLLIRGELSPHLESLFAT